MSFAEARERRQVWVFYRQSSGAVLRVSYRQPWPSELPIDGDGIGVFETTLSEKACNQAHQLVVHNGQVRVRGSLTRRR